MPPCRLLNLLTALSLLLCVAACVLWVRSYFASDYVRRVGIDGQVSFINVNEWVIDTGRGYVAITRSLDRFRFRGHRRRLRQRVGTGTTRARRRDVAMARYPHAGEQDLLRPYPAAEMEAAPVGTRVNNPRVDDPSCAEPSS